MESEFSSSADGPKLRISQAREASDRSGEVARKSFDAYEKLLRVYEERSRKKEVGAGRSSLCRPLRASLYCCLLGNTICIFLLLFRILEL
mmetsp:Transcript_26567/g.103432  ORF Transcript_26567/g.103432 Transcript_26567/m.103432 type:complete len:90 (-) Transcript_26567:1842-2111(-)